MFDLDDTLVEAARAALHGRSGLRFLVGAAGTGKTTIAAEIGARHGVDVLDMDARIYGSWHGRFDPIRHPASHAWSAAADPLAWQLALEPEAYLAFQGASAAEVLDLLAAELHGDDPCRPILADGGFGSVGVLARIVSPDRIVCLALPPGDQAAVWTATEDRRAFLDVVRGVTAIADPVGRFLALDAHLASTMVRDAGAAGIPVLERHPDDGIVAFGERVARPFGFG
ncbi:MAG: hypothetical protein ACYC65_09185 [Candidatus Limnocylindrales bacterium]